FKFANAIADSIAINNAIADGGTLASLPYVPYEVAEEAMTGLEPSVLKSRYKLDLVLQKLNLFPQTPLNKFWPEKAPKVEIKRYAFLTAIYLARGESNSLTQEYLDFLLNNKNAMEANNDSTFLIAYALTRYQRMINNPVWNDFLRILTQHKFGFLNRGTRDLIVVYNYTPMLQQVISERKYDTSALVYSAIYNNNVTNSQILQSATDPKDRAVFEEWKKRFIDWGYK
ncbi:MAG: hypothetical protein KBA03_06810, partial [Anaerolineaceae bacterium]|nr:hypothetical protein [Anaerolineaceae bacterium]